MTDVPERVRALADERQAARAAKDYDRADALRDEIAGLGFRVVDGPGGWTLEPRSEPPARRVRAADVASVLEHPAEADVSVHWVDEGWPQDVARGLAAFRAHGHGRQARFVVADLAEADPAAHGPDVEVLALEPGTGWGAARNAGLRRATGRVVLAVDGSIEPTGDVVGPLVDALEDPSVGVCGPFGISTTDLRDFHESDGPDVDAIEGYLMAFRRDVLRDAGLFDERFRWYRTADVEISFRLKDAGYRAVVVDVPVRRHEHRVWEATPASERDRLSRRNYARFLDRFRGRFDLLVDAPGRG
jgi:cysteinyl-tRNA synthetase